MEKPFFFNTDGANLFGMIHSPDDTGAEKKTGLVFCAPFAEEKLWSHRSYVNFARILADKGYHVLRFDYRGHGDSDGRFKDSTIESRVQDIIQAVSWLRKETGINSIGLLGLRLGALLSVLASQRLSIDFLILWETILNGATYFQQCLRSNLATQLALYRKVIQTRDELIDQFNTGEHVNIDGYLISPEFYRQIIEVNFDNNIALPRVPIFACKINKTDQVTLSPDLESFKTLCEGTHEKSCFKNVKEMPFWAELKIYYQAPTALYYETMRWIERLHNDPSTTITT